LNCAILFVIGNLAYKTALKPVNTLLSSTVSVYKFEKLRPPKPKAGVFSCAWIPVKDNNPNVIDAKINFRLFHVYIFLLIYIQKIQ
jgi:hypothetical protein